MQGFTLIEALVALAVLLGSLLAMGPLVHGALGLTGRARTITTASVLASSKLEQLSALSRHVEIDDDGALSLADDTTTNLTGVVPGAGGRGLQPGGDDTIWSSTAGFVEYLDAAGRSLGADAAAAAGARFVRRWSVSSRSAMSPDLLVLSVRVTSIAEDHTERRAAGPGEVRLVAAMTRTVR